MAKVKSKTIHYTELGAYCMIEKEDLKTLLYWLSTHGVRVEEKRAIPNRKPRYRRVKFTEMDNET